MSSQIIKEQPELTGNPQKFCRLCMSEEMLEDVFNDEDIIRRISDLLSIVVSEGDQISRSVCAICRARLYEFHDYKLSCLEVQEVLRSQNLPAEEKDHTEQVQCELQEDTEDQSDTEDLLEEMQISQENTELDEEPVEKPVRNRKILPKPGQKRSIYEYKVPCSTCGIKVRKSCIRAHENKHRFHQMSPPYYKCERGCAEIKFMCRKAQLQHYVNVHDYDAPECNICSKLFRSKASLVYHTKSAHQLKQYFCTICNNSYALQYLLDQHMKVHNDKMEHKCAMCNYATNMKHNLYRHMRMHERKDKK